MRCTVRACMHTMPGEMQSAWRPHREQAAIRPRSPGREALLRLPAQRCHDAQRVRRGRGAVQEPCHARTKNKSYKILRALSSAHRRYSGFRVTKTLGGRSTTHRHATVVWQVKHSIYAIRYAVPRTQETIRYVRVKYVKVPRQSMWQSALDAYVLCSIPHFLFNRGYLGDRIRVLCPSE
jgi:hypothetical protein